MPRPSLGVLVQAGLLLRAHHREPLRPDARQRRPRLPAGSPLCVLRACRRRCNAASHSPSPRSPACRWPPARSTTIPASTTGAAISCATGTSSTARSAKAPTWHERDYGVELVGPQRDAGPADPTSARSPAWSSRSSPTSIPPRRVYLELDFRADGTTEYSEQIPSAQWQPLTFLVNAPTWYDAVALTIRKESDGHAVLARLELGDGQGCTGAPIPLDNRPPGAWCETRRPVRVGRLRAIADLLADVRRLRRRPRRARTAPGPASTGPPPAGERSPDQSMELYRRYGPALLRKAERMLQDRDEAKDLVQGLFLDLLQRPATPADLPYLYRAITHRCLNHLRDRRNQGRLLSNARRRRCAARRARGSTSASSIGSCSPAWPTASTRRRGRSSSTTSSTT